MSETAGAAGVGPMSHAIFRVARLHKSLAGRLLRETGLHPGQELTLMTLWVDGPQRQVDLAAAIDSDAPTMARSLARLERDGLVRRTRSDSDRRVVLVEATEASLACRPKVEAAWQELERLTVGSLSPQQQAGIAQDLRLLESNLEPLDP
ncbi:MarR family winged helix-turn-helix transcriptional regulator [Nocardioides sp. SOB77]|uniref:MarR family winged helix-turn-helix transcriptional regulator n=1 Tax=Nocardioides oceani TaxID=3058369 RepID=A0ABT8FC91_9ACTN|nr:MarR family winged helix-turn-helix transcriptional regulator [Nocardioides oceani]MDN4172199.1 MarR family winged helix-turn-helix transcriptional regulator [Nocardioides oceani]